MSAARPAGLSELARLYNVQTSYYNVFKQREEASTESLIRVLQVLGAPLDGMGRYGEALRERRQALWQSPVSPVIVAWDGKAAAFDLRCPAHWADKSVDVRLVLESGEIRSWNRRLARTVTVHRTLVEGSSYLIKRVPIPTRLPWGYHNLVIQIAGREFHAMVISAPAKAYTPDGADRKRLWGVFIPLYAQRSERSWASGDFADLQKLATWVKELGGGLIGTLPLLAAFLDKPFEISPYSPASRLFWNEFYLDVTNVPELEVCPAASALLASPAFQRDIRQLRRSPTVDYRGQTRLKRKVLEELAKTFFSTNSKRRSAFHEFVNSHKGVEAYACFRAVCERQGASWPHWPERLRDGIIRPNDYAESAKRYHLYAQWLAHEQLDRLAERTNGSGCGLYLDLPLGVHPEGYDVWRERDLFATGVSGGAPPDSVFTGGQDWGFAPLHPTKIRAQGYRYIKAVLRHHLEHASYLRIDHVMGLHRLFWIPKGMRTDQGVYVRYPEEDLFAILSLESHRYRAVIAGENLGTVPRSVNSMMVRHGVQRMYVVQYELKPKPEKALPGVPRDSLASLNTHDMRPFAAFWEGLDIQDMVQMGLMDEAKSSLERNRREKLKRALLGFLTTRGWLEKPSKDIATVMKACLAYISASSARIVLINLEDLWLEREPQNLPGTGDQSPNWGKKARYSMEEFGRMPDVLEMMQMVGRHRRDGKRNRKLRAG